MTEPTTTARPISTAAAFSGMLLSPLTGAIARLSTIREFMAERPRLQENYSTHNLFKPGEFDPLGPKLPTREIRIEAPEAAHRQNYFVVRETPHLALAACGIVMVRENLVSSTKGDCPTPTFDIIGPPTRRDIIALARVTSYEQVKQLACDAICRRNERLKAE